MELRLRKSLLTVRKVNATHTSPPLAEHLDLLWLWGGSGALDVDYIVHLGIGEGEEVQQVQGMGLSW